MRWTVTVSWDTEVEADDEGDALMQADREFSFMSEAEATCYDDEEEGDDSDDEEEDEDAKI